MRAFIVKICICNSSLLFYKGRLIYVVNNIAVYITRILISDLKW